MFGARLVPEGLGRFVGSDFFMPLPVGAPNLKPKSASWVPNLQSCPVPVRVRLPVWGGGTEAVGASLGQQCTQTRNAAVCSTNAARHALPAMSCTAW